LYGAKQAFTRVSQTLAAAKGRAKESVAKRSGVDQKGHGGSRKHSEGRSE